MQGKSPSMSAASDQLLPGQEPPAGERLCLVGAMQTHPGPDGVLNEDVAAYVLPLPAEPFARSGALALVADGMGGHAAGEVASRLAAEVIRAIYYDRAGTVPEVLAACLEAANRTIYQRSQSDPGCAGMGTTCTVVAVRDDMIYLGHVGDSRAYILRDGRLRQISQDHSVVAELVRQGTITSSEAMQSPYRNLVFRALGTHPAVEPLIWNEGLPLCPGDVIVLCSDGLTDGLEDAVIAAAVQRLAPLQACETLIAAALQKGVNDNISVGVFAVRERSTLRPGPGDPTRRVAVAHQAGVTQGIPQEVPK
jgi:PPM family protein phosphatase